MAAGHEKGRFESRAYIWRRNFWAGKPNRRSSASNRIIRNIGSTLFLLPPQELISARTASDNEFRLFQTHAITLETTPLETSLAQDDRRTCSSQIAMFLRLSLRIPHTTQSEAQSGRWIPQILWPSGSRK